MKSAELGRAMASDLNPLSVRRERLGRAMRNNGSPHIMGIINATEDSFFAGSRAEASSAVEKGLMMWKNGATWVDVGGESTRPGAEPVSIQDELKRVIPVIRALREANSTGLISVDTRRAEVAKEALDAGADMVNDVSGLRDPAMHQLILERGCAVCIMHMQGEPGTMQERPEYEDCVQEISAELEKKMEALQRQGHPSELMSIDPGIGFGKTHEHNMALLMAGKDLTMEPSTSILWGVSRKSIVGHLTGHQHPEDRLAGTLAIAAVAHRMGIDIVRVHDVLEHRDLFETLNAFSRKA